MLIHVQVTNYKGQTGISDELQATSCHAAQVEWHTDDADEISLHLFKQA